MEASSQNHFIKGRPFVGVLPELAEHPAEYFRKQALENDGALLRVNLGLGSVFIVSQPEHVEHILFTNANNYWKGRIFGRLKMVFGESLLLSEGDTWKAQRRMMQPEFSTARLRQQIEVFNRIITKRLQGWEEAALNRRPLNLEKEMHRITIQIGAGAMFSKDMSDETAGMIADSFDTFVHHTLVRLFTFFLPEWVRLPGQRRAEKAIGKIEEYLWSMVSERRGAATGCPHDLLSVFIDSTDKDNGSSPAKSKKLLRDHLMTALFGGYESTASSLIWMWCLLSRHPEIAERIRAEVDQVIGDRAPVYEDLMRLTYTGMVIDEVLRLYPPFWGSFRSSYKDDVIDGVRIPGGSSLILCPYVTQRDPRIWENPDTFDPERFRPDAPQRHRCAYYPFLEGPRSCIGRFFAIAEMKVMVALGLRSYQLDLSPGFRLDSIAEGTLRIRHVPWVRVTKREHALIPENS